MASPYTANSVDQALVEKLAQVVLRCGTQVLHRNAEGRERLDSIQSNCSDMTVAGDRVVITLDGTEYTLAVRDSENSDGGDLVDLFLQYGSREELEVAVATNLLAFGDPALATLQAAGLRGNSLLE